MRTQLKLRKRFSKQVQVFEYELKNREGETFQVKVHREIEIPS